MAAVRTIRVLVVDDSALMRKMIPLILSRENGIEVVGTAMDGEFALKKITELAPDVVTLDVDMPNMDGLTALQVIVKDFNIPVILVSSLTREGAETALKGLETGAFDFVAKPDDAISVRISSIADELVSKIRAASLSRPRHRELRIATSTRRWLGRRASPTAASEKVVVIGISTGGPQALTEVLPLIPTGFAASVLVVQHMPEGFTELFARRLDALCNVSVKEAADGDSIRPGRILIAPGGRHLKVKRTPFGLVSVISQSPPVSGHRPSATVLFRSVAEEIGDKAIGVLMTGMGDDGAEGLGAIRERGGATIAQDEATSVIYGMPKVAVEKGFAREVLGLHEIIPRIVEMVTLNGSAEERRKKDGRSSPVLEKGRRHRDDTLHGSG
jgi:two-component system chemotaxis response regulator CheB